MKFLDISDQDDPGYVMEAGVDLLDCVLLPPGDAADLLPGVEEGEDMKDAPAFLVFRCLSEVPRPDALDLSLDVTYHSYDTETHGSYHGITKTYECRSRFRALTYADRLMDDGNYALTIVLIPSQHPSDHEGRVWLISTDRWYDGPEDY